MTPFRVFWDYYSGSGEQHLMSSKSTFPSIQIASNISENIRIYIFEEKSLIVTMDCTEWPNEIHELLLIVCYLPSRSKMFRPYGDVLKYWQNYYLSLVDYFHITITYT